MEIEKIIEMPHIIIKRQTPKNIKRIGAKPSIVVLEQIADKSFTKYGVYCGVSQVGYVSLIDKDNGVWVDYIKNYAPERYSGFGKIADQIEVEHCLSRGLTDFNILSEATPSSMAYHYKRGKRFYYIEDDSVKINLRKKYGTFNLNIIMERLLKKYSFPEINEIVDCVPMFMPKDLIKKYFEVVKKYPLLRR